MKKITLIFFLFWCFNVTYSQNYADIVKFSINNATLGTIENEYETAVQNILLEIFYPKQLNEKIVLITGLTSENTTLNLTEDSERTHLNMFRLNLGIKYQYSEKWSGTYVLLPKIASDFYTIGSSDFQIGGLIIFDCQYNESKKLKFGLYSSTENFGITLTPLFGLWHQSKSKKFYINATFPIRMDANFKLTKNFSLGSDLSTSLKSYNLSEFNSDYYVQEESIRFAFYSALGLMNHSIILRGKIGFDSTDYSVYSSDDKLGVQVLAFPIRTDERNRLNTEFDASLYFGLDAIYRFDLTKEN